MKVAMQETKLLVFQSWVSHWDWYSYAKANPKHVPFLLVDRSPCSDPFFDPYAPSTEERRVLISGLCRCLKHFTIGMRIIYITRIASKVCKDLGIDDVDSKPRYFGVAALSIAQVWNSHAEAARSFHPRRYVVSPDSTPFPPNLAHSHDHKLATVARESCVVFDVNKKPYTPPDSNGELWKRQYLEYYKRQHVHALRVAECKVESANGLECLRLDPASAVILTPKDWGGMTMNIMGFTINEQKASRIRACIARGT